MNIISYLRCFPNPTGLIFLLKKVSCCAFLLKGGLILAGTGPAELPVTQPQSMLALPGHSTALSSLGSDISLLCVRELPALLAFEGFGFRRAF